MKRDVERRIDDSITDIISLTVDNDLPKTADALREIQLLMLLEACQNSEAGDKSDVKRS